MLRSIREGLAYVVGTDCCGSIAACTGTANLFDAMGCVGPRALRRPACWA